MKIAATITVLSMAFGLSTASASNPVFSRTLDACLAQRPGALVECARVAAADAGNERVRVVQDLKRAAEGPTGQGDKIVEVCSDDGYEICDIYDCYEDEDSSVCKFLGTTCGDYWCE